MFLTTSAIERNEDANSCRGDTTLSDTSCLSINLRKSSPPQNRQLNILICNSKQHVDDFVKRFSKTDQ
jgi:hypothetical protein